MKTADIFCLPHNPIILVIICNYTHGVSGSLTAQLGAGNILGTLQVHHITVILKVVKFAAPVRTKYQKVYLILDDITELLPWYSSMMISSANRYGVRSQSFSEAVPHVQLTTLNIVSSRWSRPRSDNRPMLSLFLKYYNVPRGTGQKFRK